MAITKSILFTSALAAAASALPWAKPLAVRATPTVEFGFPKTGGQELSLTDADLSQLVLVTIGRGVQNYACPSGAPKPVQTGTGTGAVAQLFDVTDKISTSQSFLNVVTDVSVGNPRPVLDDVADDGSKLGPLNDQFRKVCFHEFTDKGVPKFDCGEKGIIFGKKLESVPPPADAQEGPDGVKAIPWLNLEATEGSRGFTKIIRIVTAGGSAPADCNGRAPDEIISVDYSAQYWMFNGE